MATDVEYRRTPQGMELRIEQKPEGPLVTINENGTVTIARAPPDEAGRLFWEAVNVHGTTYVQKIAALTEQVRVLELQNKVLALDPFREVVQGSPHKILAELHKVDKETISFTDVSAVQDAIQSLAIKAIQ